MIREAIPTLNVLNRIPVGDSLQNPISVRLTQVAQYDHLLGTDVGEARKSYVQLLGRRLQDFVGYDGEWEFVM